MQQEEITTDILIIGGGAAGCLAAVEAKEKDPGLDVTIMEKAHIDRSGCLAAGINAINAYINPGETPESFVEHVRKDALGLIREDLVKGIAEELNNAVEKVEKWGLPILKDKDDRPVPRGRWNIKINGEALKPIIAEGARRSGARIINRVVATNLLTKKDRVVGAAGLGVRDGKFYIIKAKATIIATGGASGIYKPNNDGTAHHKIWYSPFNTGAGYAMGIRAGAEMTSFEMRFIALRTKDAIAPTGTLALGFGAPQLNALGEDFMEEKYKEYGGNRAPTAIRVYGPTKEMKEGRGPCYLDTTHLKESDVKDLKEAYLDMYPLQVLHWSANNIDPSKEPIEVQGTEPYIVGGHCQAGYWVTPRRETTLKGLYAAGDVAGGSPYKFASGCFAEGIIAARAAAEYVKNKQDTDPDAEQIENEKRRVYAPLRRHENKVDGVTPKEMEERLQKVMDEYAGGVRTYYEMTDQSLKIAQRQLEGLRKQEKYLIAKDNHELMLAHEVKDRIDVAEVLVQHLKYRKETRWPGFQTRPDYPKRDDKNWLKFVNSKRNPETGNLEVFTRPYEQFIKAKGGDSA
ncbi:MAG: adenylyl-sulfate reductase subunit alpha [Candidatus Hydrothermarchaeales archaeon]